MKDTDTVLTQALELLQRELWFFQMKVSQLNVVYRNHERSKAEQRLNHVSRLEALSLLMQLIQEAVLDGHVAPTMNLRADLSLALSLRRRCIAHNKIHQGNEALGDWPELITFKTLMGIP